MQHHHICQMSAPLTSDIAVPVTSPEMGLAQQQTQRAPLNLPLPFCWGSECPLRTARDSACLSEPPLAPAAGCLMPFSLSPALSGLKLVCVPYFQTEVGVTARGQAETDILMAHVHLLLVVNFWLPSTQRWLNPKMPEQSESNL